MKSLRGFSSIVFLAALSSLLSIASAAQTVAHGKFTLTHEVHWQNALVPSGDYEFFVKRGSGVDFLLLERGNTNSIGFFLMIPTSSPAGPTATDELHIVLHGDQRYVSSMELSQYGVDLDFSVPNDTVHADKPLAQARAATFLQSE